MKKGVRFGGFVGISLWLQGVRVGIIYAEATAAPVRVADRKSGRPQAAAQPPQSNDTWQRTCETMCPDHGRQARSSATCTGDTSSEKLCMHAHTPGCASALDTGAACWQRAAAHLFPSAPPEKLGPYNRRPPGTVPGEHLTFSRTHSTCFSDDSRCRSRPRLPRGCR